MHEIGSVLGVEESDIRDIEAGLDYLRGSVEPDSGVVQTVFAEPAVLLPVVAGLVQVTGQIFEYVRSLESRIKELEAKG